MTAQPLSRLPVYEKSALRRRGACGALFSCDAECFRPAGHLLGDLPHATRGPYGGPLVEYDDEGQPVIPARNEATR